MDSTENITVITAFDAEAIDSGSNSTSSLINLDYLEPNGYFTVQVTTAGAGSILQLQYLVSVDGVTYVTPEDKDGTAVADIVTAHAVGTKIYPVYPVMAPYMQLYADVTVANATSVTVKLALQ